MKVFIAGATGAVGRPLIRALVARGHDVVGMTRSAAKGAPLRALGAELVVADAFDADAVLRVVVEQQPDVVVDQLTALEHVTSLKNFDAAFAMTNRLRTRGTDNVLAAAQAAGARLFVAQSYGGWTYARGESGLKVETDAFEPRPLAKQTESLAAIKHLEAATTDAAGITGIVLRYANFYGPGTSFAADGPIAAETRRRRLPVVADGGGVWSFIHVGDAAAATVAAIEAGVGGIFNVVDDEPMAAKDWIPAYAEALGAKPPRHVPAWLARLLAGEVGVAMMTRMPGMSNAKARATFGWQPMHRSVREGFRAGLGPTAQLRGGE